MGGKVFTVATNNQNKVIEIRAMLKPLDIEVLTPAEAGVTEFIAEETGKTFEENAIIKANACSKITGKVSIADDSGLEVLALDGAPGVYSARFSGTGATDKKNNELLLEKLKNVPAAERTASFVSVIAAVLDNGDIITARGECRGKIAFKPSGKGGFGYDPLFIPDEYAEPAKSFADISPEEKNSISHRAKALQAFYEKLKESENV